LPRGPFKENAGMKNIYVGNLDFSATEEGLRTLFAAHGAVEKVTIVRDRASGQPRGFAFVEMTDASQAGQAITGLNGALFDGRALKVSEALSKVGPRRGHD
jgi:cold-inducible RNA-binding protein